MKALEFCARQVFAWRKVCANTPKNQLYAFILKGWEQRTLEKLNRLPLDTRV